MLLNQQFNSPLSDLPRSVHESRAAQVSVYLHTDPRGDALYALNPAMRPLPLQSAIEVIHELPPEEKRSALPTAEIKLASAIYVEGAERFKPFLEQLVGNKQMVERYERGRAVAGIQGNLTYAEVRRLAYGQVTREGDHLHEDKRPESRLDLSTMTTTVDIPSKSTLPFEQLATALDPLSWSKLPSSFWRQSDRAELDDKLGISILPTKQLGQSWDGFLFEHVEWNWNTSVVSSFRNLLKIHFDVDATNKKINMTFRLHSCEGSQLYALASKRGVDVDYGGQTAEYHSAEEAQLTTQKNVRFSDMLNRRTPFEGAVGSGALLLYLAPAVVGLWMNYLLSYQR